MHYVSPDFKARVDAKIREGLAKVKAHYGLDLPFPKITYELTGRVAGTGNYRHWHIRMNGGLCVSHPDEQVNQTAPPALGHLVTDRVHPQAHAQGAGRTVTRTGRRRRNKRELHGPRWQEVMAVLGASDARLHTMDVSALKQEKTLTRFEYKCTSCQKVILISPKLHRQLLISPMARWHRTCKGSKLELVGHVITSNKTGVISRRSASPQSAPPETFNTPVISKQRPLQQLYTSKLDHCKALFKSNASCSRPTMIALFVSEAKCTSAGAATYYAKLNKKLQR